MGIPFKPGKKKIPTKADRERARNLLRRGGEALREAEKQRKQEQKK